MKISVKSPAPGCRCSCCPKEGAEAMVIAAFAVQKERLAQRPILIPGMLVDVLRKAG